jgi:hypothetical protein
MTRHRTTRRLPREHFEAVERAHLHPEPSEEYDVPLWCKPKVHRDQHAQVAASLYSLPPQFKGRRLQARADRTTVRFYEFDQLVKMHPRVGPGQRHTDPADFPPEKMAYALRDVAFLVRKASEHGDAVGRGAALPESGHGVDRKDARRGYTPDNVVLACDACNRIKTDILSFEQMLEIGFLLRRWRTEGRDPRRKDSRRSRGRPALGNLRQEIEEWNRAHASGRTSIGLGRPPAIGRSRRRSTPEVGIEAVDHRGANLGDQAEDLIAGRVHQGCLAVRARGRLRGLGEADLLQADRTLALLGPKSSRPISVSRGRHAAAKPAPGLE